MQKHDTTKGKHLTYPERLIIERWKNKEKKSNRAIAHLLGKAPQTIHNEIKRGQVDLTFYGGSIEYSADVGQSKYDRNRLAVGKTDCWTPEKEEAIRQGVLSKHSPEAISQQKDMPCFSTIYSWIKKGWIRGISQKDLLYPRKTKKDQSNKLKAIRKKGGLSIDQRPEAINRRKEIGHFEIDLVILNKKKEQ